jgi:hypothetical protein
VIFRLPSACRSSRIERFPCFAIGIDDVDALRDPVALAARLAEFKTLVAIDRRIAVLNHGHEDAGFGARKINAW